MEAWTTIAWLGIEKFWLGFIDFLKDYRKGPDYKKFLQSAQETARKYWDFTKREISRIKANPKLADIHAMNFKNRFEN